VRALPDDLWTSIRAPTDELLDALGELAGGIDADRRQRAVLRAAMAATPGDSAAVTCLEPLPGRACSYPDNFFCLNEQSLFEEIHSVSPWVLAAHTQGRNEHPIRISDVLSQRQYRSLPIYRDLFRSLEIDYQVAFSVPLGRQTSLCVVVNRSGSDFSSTDIGSLRSLGRILGAVAQLPHEATPASAPPNEDSRTDLSSLTEREQLVLSLTASGSSNVHVAGSLGISQRTVNKHLEHIYAKLGVTNRTQAASLWHRAH
jgi:DNA-binding CsgD family transcriptional regulator